MDHDKVSNVKMNLERKYSIDKGMDAETIKKMEGLA